MPADSRPIDVAISRDKISILFDPPRIVTVSRSDFRSVDVLVGDPGNPWRAIDRDPVDGSLWIASDDRVALLHIGAGGEREIVPGPRVEGQGGFRQIRLTRDAIYAMPGASDDAVWRLSRTGKLLGRAFPRAAESEVAAVRDAGSRDFWLSRNFAGEAVVYESRTGQLRRALDDGNWIAVKEQFPAHASSPDRSLRGEGVGTPSETWFFTDQVRGFFFLPDGPTLLGSLSPGVRRTGTALFALRGEKLVTDTETCTTGPLLAVAADAEGFAAVSSAMKQTAGNRTTDISSQLLVGRFPPKSP